MVVVCYERHHGIPGTPLPANSTHIMEVMFSECRREGSALEEEGVGRRVGEEEAGRHTLGEEGTACRLALQRR
jgi:hypothetical protein